MKKYFYSLFIPLCLILSACSQKVTWECNLPPQQTNIDDSPTTTNVTPEVYLDSTLSMEGFVTIKDSNYIQVLQSLDEVIASLSDSQPQYYSLGTTAQILPDDNSILATKRNFYQQQQQDALLEVALNTNPTQSDKLIILVTDLLRATSDNTTIIDAFKTYVEQGFSIGILGIRSQFNGQIYDGLLKNKGTNNTINFNTRLVADPEEYRPFYLIFIGNYQTIVDYFEELEKRNSSLISSDNLLIVNEQIIQEMAKFNITEDYKELSPGFTRVSEIYNQDINLIVTNKTLVDFLQIGNNQTPSEYQYNFLEYFPLPYSLAVKPELQVTSCENENDTGFTNCQTQKNESNFLQFKLLLGQENFMSLLVTTKETNISNHIEVVNVDVIPSEIILPAWVDEWSYNETARNESDIYLGARTYKLKNFLQNLVTIVTESGKTKETNLIGRFCFVVHQQ